MTQPRPKLINLWRIYLQDVLKWVHTSTDRMRTTENVFMISVAILIGVLGGFGAIGFRWLIHFIQELAHPDWSGTLDAIEQIPWYYKLAIPTIGGLIVGPLIYYSTREARGLPDVMESVALRGGRLHPRVMAETTLATAISIGSGMSVGREGPIAQIGASIGSTLGQIFKVNVRRLRTFLGCGAAAGIAATFNTPIAGALFSLEVILGDFAISQFSPIVISSVVATAISRHYLGDVPAFIVPAYTLVNPMEFLLYGILGVLTAVAGVLFIKTLYVTEDLYGKMPVPTYLKPATGGFLIGLIGLAFPHIFGVGYDAMDQALFGELAWQTLIILVVVKMLATSITLGSGAAGGIFAPSLFIGSMVGGAFGILVNYVFPDITGSSGAYALVAMGALVSATTRSPLTSILIIFEMTSEYKIILPLMITCILSTVIASYLMKPSIYTFRLLRRGVDIHKGQEVNIMRSLKVSSARSNTFETIQPNATLDDLLAKLADSTQSNFYIVDDNHQLQGIVTFDNVRNLLSYGDTLEGVFIAYDLARTDLPTVSDEDALDRVLLLLGQYDIDELPVVDRQDGHFVGIIDREHVMDAYNREVARRDLAGEFSSMVSTLGTQQVVELGENYMMVEVEAPRHFIEQSIQKLNIRSRYGVQILLIKKPDSKNDMAHFVPSPDYVIQEDDVLLLAGDNENIQRARHL